MQRTTDVEGGRTDDTEGSSHPAPGTELLDPTTDPNSSGPGEIAGRPEGLQLQEPTPTARSRIGVHRTFRLSSSNDATGNEAFGSGKESGFGRNSDSAGG